MEMEQVGVDVTSPSTDNVQSEVSIEDLADEYFSSVSSIARNLIREKEVKKQESHKNWKNLSQEEKDSALNEWFLDDGIRLRYEIRSQGAGQQFQQEAESIFEAYPKLKVQCGSKIVHYSESEHSEQVITWRDEFSAPFSWDTKCQQNLGLYSFDDPPSRADTSDLNCSRESTSTDLDSSELFLRLKDKATRLDSEEINIHVNPSFSLENKSGGLATTQLEARLSKRQESQTVTTQPKPGPKPNVVQRKPSGSKPDSLPVVKPRQPPPTAPGGSSAKFAVTANRSNSQSSVVSRSSSTSSTSSSRPGVPPPSKPPAVVKKPSQPAPPTPKQRPADTSPLPPPTVNSKPPQPSIKREESTRAESRQSSLARSSSGARGDSGVAQSSAADDIDFKLDLSSPQTPTADVKQSPDGAGEEAAPTSDAAFDFLLQW